MQSKLPLRYSFTAKINFQPQRMQKIDAESVFPTVKYKEPVQKAALMCYTKLYKGPAEGKTAGFVLEMFHVEQIFFPEGSK